MSSPKITEKYADYNWIRKVIGSCVLVIQVNRPVDNLLRLFLNKHEEEKMNSTSLYRELFNLQQNKLHKILNENKI